MPDETAPIGIAMTTDGDIEITTATNDGGIRFASGVEAVTNNINSMVRLFQGEWFADLELGVPYYQDILGEKYNEAQVLAAFRQAIFQVPFVESIQRLASSYDGSTRTLKVYFEVVTEFGSVTDTVEI